MNGITLLARKPRSASRAHRGSGNSFRGSTSLSFLCSWDPLLGMLGLKGTGGRYFATPLPLLRGPVFDTISDRCVSSRHQRFVKCHTYCVGDHAHLQDERIVLIPSVQSWRFALEKATSLIRCWVECHKLSLRKRYFMKRRAGSD